MAMLCLLPLGCATVGKDFPVAGIAEIRIGETSRNEIRSMFGSPWRVGVEDGEPTWTYGNYNYRAFSANKAKDLVVRFDNSGMVTSYTFSTTDHGE